MADVNLLGSSNGQAKAWAKITRAIPFYTPEIDPLSRDVINFRPNIRFVEPDIIPVEAIQELVAESAMDKMNRARDTAATVNKLARAVQVRVDQRANFTAHLDPKVDALVIQAQRRKGAVPPTEITYDQYKQCKQNIVARGEALAEAVMVTPEKVAAAVGAPPTAANFSASEASKVGLNRPETTVISQVVEPLDMGSFQDKVLKALANLIWKKAIKPTVVNSSPPVSWIFKALPDKIFPDDTLNIGSFNDVLNKPGSIAFEDGNKTSSIQGEDNQTDNENLGGADPNQAENPMAFSDCMTITKAYERSAAFATTEEAVFAMLTPTLQTMIGQTNSMVKQIDSAKSISTVKGLVEQIGNEVNAATTGATALIAAVQPPGMSSDALAQSSPGEPILTDFVPVSPEGEREWDRIFDSKCIPCGLRLNFSAQALDAFANLGDALWGQMLAWLQEMIRQIQTILDFFKNLGSSERDLCAFINFICEFVCLPDLMKILALLSALLLKLSIEFSSLFDIILSLIGPLIQPLLSGLVSMIHQAIMMIVKPIECIIDAIVAMLRKLDWRNLMANSGALNVNFGGTNPIKQAIDDDRKALEKAQANLNQLRQEGASDDQIQAAEDDVAKAMANGEYRQYGNQHSPKVRDGYYTGAQRAQAGEASSLGQGIQNDAEAGADYAFGTNLSSNNTRGGTVSTLNRFGNNVALAGSDLGTSLGNTFTGDSAASAGVAGAASGVAANASSLAENPSVGNLANTVESLKPLLHSLVAYLDEIMGAVVSFEAKLMNELQKLMGQYLGGSGGALVANLKKLGIIQMIGIIEGLIALLGRGCSCNEPDTLERVATSLTQGENPLTFYTDDDGTVHIQEETKDTEEAIEAIIDILGGSGPGKRVLESVGDPLLDTEIAKTVEALTTPVSIELKCTKKVSVADAEQVNQWIAELEAE